jgi:hypothetical protein
VSYPQKGHGKKRPRRFHHGPAEGRRAQPKLAAIENAERRERTTRDELRSVAARYNEDIDVWQALEHVAPFVPRIEVAL